MLPRAQRLTTSQFDRAFAQSQTVRHPLVVLKAHFRGDDEATIRAAFVVPKKQGKATFRNRTRRRLRERFRLISTKNEAKLSNSTKNEGNLAGCDLIFLTTPQTHGATTAEIDNALREVLRRAGKRIASDIEAGKSVETSPTISETISPVVKNEAASFFVETETIEEQSHKKSILPITILALSMIRFYQRFISPGLPPSCRFEPSCSRYTYATIERFGLWRGGFLGLIRVCKCHPWHEGGLDPVPLQFPSWRSENQNRKRSWPFFGVVNHKK
ncbi:ribonuclease P protein component/putative membrane protein insertion efficiency factor,TIGR00278 [Abditibacterium utsteinense]|uniref:Multifunctional fusion protein n=1 Tax=Abditibacterium utsteinense TaxID=1960156 RepID=A0A2S8SSK9_9BACT|nr:membrane protein insertion efficiency factor YidD [Abditibacterium utsteinense]PQV63790.1 ribonuclease P protein component/putative membrane protein insertion efficiency factor,TIGR00278 [Abditibacterium utsteinense]